jgi:hypothetical protein
MRIFLVTICLIIGLKAISQIAVNTDGSSPDSSAMLDVKSTAKGKLIPSLATSQRNVIVSTTEGLPKNNLTPKN